MLDSNEHIGWRAEEYFRSEKLISSKRFSPCVRSALAQPPCPGLISDWGVVIYQIQTDKSFIKSQSKHVNGLLKGRGVKRERRRRDASLDIREASI